MATYHEAMQSRIFDEIESCNWNERDEQGKKGGVVSPAAEVSITQVATPESATAGPHALYVAVGPLCGALLECHVLADSSFKELARDSHGFSLHHSSNDQLLVLLQRKQSVLSNSSSSSSSSSSTLIPEDLSYEWAASWMHLLLSLSLVGSPQQLSVAALASPCQTLFPSLQASSVSLEGPIRLLRTSSAPPLPPAATPRLVPLEAGLFVDGIAAALISRCETLSVPAFLLLAVHPIGCADLSHLSNTARCALPLLKRLSPSRRLTLRSPATPYRSLLREGCFLDSDIYQ